MHAADDRLAVEDVRTFVPARDFARSKRFYEALAPTIEEWGATVTYTWDPCGVLLHFTQFHDA